MNEKTLSKLAEEYLASQQVAVQFGKTLAVEVQKTIAPVFPGLVVEAELTDSGQIELSCRDRIVPSPWVRGQQEKYGMNDILNHIVDIDTPAEEAFPSLSFSASPGGFYVTFEEAERVKKALLARKDQA